MPNQRVGTVTVTYSLPTYDSKTETLILTGGKTVHNVQLIKSTIEQAYWFRAVQVTQASGATPHEKQRAFLAVWKEIDQSTLEPDVKAAAARELVSALPLKKDTPATLTAYSKVDPASLHSVSNGMQEAVNTPNVLSVQSAQVPAVVAADLAAMKVAEYQITTGTKVDPKFFTDFWKTYGPEASTRLRATTALIEAKSQTRATAHAY